MRAREAPAGCWCSWRHKRRARDRYSWDRGRLPLRTEAAPPRLYSTNSRIRVAEVKRIPAAKAWTWFTIRCGKLFLKACDCLKPRGMMIHFGVSSGQIEPLNTRALTERGSLYLTRPTLLTHVSSPAEIAWRAGDISAGSEKASSSSEWSTNIRWPKPRRPIAIWKDVPQPGRLFCEPPNGPPRSPSGRRRPLPARRLRATSRPARWQWL